MEWNGATREQIRESGALCVAGEFLSLLMCWSDSQPLHAAFGDFCSGLNPRLTTMLAAACHMAHVQNAVLAVNILRGRDPQTNEDRALIAQYCADWIDQPKHRGQLQLAGMAVLAASRAHPEGSLGLVDAQATVTWKAWRAKFFSYRSTAHQTFDSAVWNNWVPQVDARPAVERFEDPRDVKRVQQRLAAVLAHRTRRLALA